MIVCGCRTKDDKSECMASYNWVCLERAVLDNNDSTMSLVFIASKRGPLRVDRALTTAAKHGKWGKHILSTKTQIFLEREEKQRKAIQTKINFNESISFHNCVCTL